MPVVLEPLFDATHFFCGVDPVFAGLHTYGEAADGRAFNQTAHYVARKHQFERDVADRHPTIVLPLLANASPGTIIHEFGHALDDALDYRHAPTVPLNDYAATNVFEAFAESFVAWFERPSPLPERDPTADALFTAINRLDLLWIP
jgi:Mlc titration factor MtfA (ptsG expression regulator)